LVKDRPPSLLDPITLTSTLGGAMTLRAAEGGHVLDERGRGDLLRKLRAGGDEAPRSLLVEAQVFAQGDAPNRAFVRFTPSALRKLAKSFDGKPVLVDHDRRMESAIGRVVSSTFEGGEGTGVIRQTLKLVKARAIEDALDGTMEFFSIGFDGKGPPTCSICDAPMVSMGIFGTMPSCEHMPGDEVETRTGKRFVEMMFADGEGLEVSAVTVPAVRETGIESIRAALSAQRAAVVRPMQGVPMSILLKLAPLLGLAADAGEDAAVAAVSKLKTERDAAQLAAAAHEGALTAARETIAAFELRDKNDRAAKLDARKKELVIELRKKIGKKDELETRILALADRDLEAAEATVAAVPSVLPVGKPPVSSGPDPAPVPGGGALSAADQAIARTLMPEERKKFIERRIAAGKEV
jgi:hypothetical protein